MRNCFSGSKRTGGRHEGGSHFPNREKLPLMTCQIQIKALLPTDQVRVNVLSSCDELKW